MVHPTLAALRGDTMITLELTPEDRDELHTILTNVLSDLRMEIAGTENADFRESLKWRQMFLERLLADLARQGPPGGAAGGSAVNRR
jgi:hypothetical protein